MKILVISLAGIGDTLFTTPLLHELRLNFPEATLDALVMWPGARDLLANNPHLNRVFQKNLLSAGRFDGLRFLHELRRQAYDVSINTHPQSRTHYRAVARIVGARRRISHEYECSGWFDRWLVNATLPQDYQRHAVENNLALLGLVGGQPGLREHRYEIFLTPEERTWADDFQAANQLTGRRWLGIHVGSGGTKNLALRRWPLQNFILLAQRLRESRPELPVLFFGGPEETASHKTIRSQLPWAIFPPTKNLRQAAALLTHGSAFLSVDTALMHVAAASQVPGQVVIETPTWNRPVEPYGNPFTLVKNPAVAGRNLDFYRYDGRGIQGTAESLQSCMDSVTVEAVFNTVNPLL